MIKKTQTASASLSEVNQSVETGNKGSLLKKLFAFFGPAYMVSVGYMDPGNWATDIAGGSAFGYTLIWVLLMSNLMALLLQSLSARLGVVRHRDLAQASRETYSRPVNMILYVLAEIAIAACDLAEVLGMAIGLHLLFGTSLLGGVCITVLDSFLLLFLMNFGIRKMEAFIITLVATIGLAFLFEMFFANPVPAEILTGFIPSLPNETALYIAIGIIGATVMPHNLYLHSALVQTRKFNRTEKEIKRAIKFNFFDSAIALNLAFFVNSAILILAASAFYKNGLFEVSEIQDAHKFLEPLLGNKLAPIFFAVALIAAGQSSTITGTLAGQIVMEGYLNLRIQPWIRRIITRLIAILPAFLAIYLTGDQATGKLLVLSQVILSLQLGFAVIPLIHFVSDKQKMGVFAIKPWVQVLAWVSATIIVSLNIRLVYGTIQEWLSHAGENAFYIWITVIPLAIGAFLLLLYITFNPFVRKIVSGVSDSVHEKIENLSLPPITGFKKIMVPVDFSKSDEKTIRHALNLLKPDSELLLVHVVETAAAWVMGKEVDDRETAADLKRLENYITQIQQSGVQVSGRLGYGNPKKVLPEIATDFRADLLVMGAHGHRFLKDLLYGTTVETVRHKLKIPVLVVR